MNKQRAQLHLPGMEPKQPSEDLSTKKIKVNKAQCLKCKDIIESTHRHDFVTCSCGAISVDGGKDYLKRSAMNLKNIKELSEYETDKPADDR